MIDIFEDGGQLTEESQWNQIPYHQKWLSSSVIHCCKAEIGFSTITLMENSKIMFFFCYCELCYCWMYLSQLYIDAGFAHFYLASHSCCQWAKEELEHKFVIVSPVIVECIYLSSTLMHFLHIFTWPVIHASMSKRRVGAQVGLLVLV